MVSWMHPEKKAVSRLDSDALVTQLPSNSRGILMDKVNGKLTVFFEEPFWVGIFERIEDGKLSVAKVTFGAEPKDYEVQEYIQKCYFSLN